MRLTFDSEAGRFRDEQGDLLPGPAVVQVMEGVMVQLDREVRELTGWLNAEVITRDEWLAGMRVILDSGAVLLAAIASGGESQVTAATWAAVAAVMAVNHRYLLNFYRNIGLGRVPPSRVVTRSLLYPGLLRPMFHDIVLDVRRAAARDLWCMRVRTAGESCRACVEWAGRWVRHSEMPRIGSLTCGQHCRCYLVFSDGPPAVP